MAGKSFNQVSQETGFSKTTLARLKQDHKDLIASKQEQALDKMLDVRALALSRLEREINDVPLASLSVTIGILSDKVRDMTGGSVSTVQHVSVKLPEDVKEATVIDLLPSANPCDEPSDQEESPANQDLDDGLPNQGAGQDPGDQDADQGAGGVAEPAGGDQGTHSSGGKFLPNWNGGGEG